MKKKKFFFRFLFVSRFKCQHDPTRVFQYAHSHILCLLPLAFRNIIFYEKKIATIEIEAAEAATVANY